MEIYVETQDEDTKEPPGAFNVWMTPRKKKTISVIKLISLVTKVKESN
jgi:hypothetical protein